MSADSSSTTEHVPLLPDSNGKGGVNRSVDNHDINDDYDGYDDWTSDRFTCTRLRTPVCSTGPSTGQQQHINIGGTNDHLTNSMGFFQRLWKELWAFKKTVLLVLIPLLASPLLIVIGDGPAKGGWVVIVMAGYWIFEVVPLAVTALLPVILYPMLGIQDSDAVCRNYLKDTNFLFVGGLIVAVAVEHWNLHKRIALSVLMLMGSQPRWLMLGFMITTAFLSMWISNTATTAMMIPIAQAVLLQLVGGNKQAFSGEVDTQAMVVSSDDDTPPSYGTVMDAGAQENHADVTANEEETQFGTQGKRNQNSLSKDAEPDKLEDNDTADNKPTPKVQGDVIDWDSLDSHDRNLSKGLMLCVCYAANIGGTATLTGTGPNLVIGGVVDDLYGRAAGLNFASWMLFAFPGMVLILFLAWLWLQFLYLGRSCSACWKDCTACLSCGKKGTSNSAGHEVIRAEYKKLGSVTWAEWAVLCHFVILALLWLFREPGFIPNGWAAIFPVSDYITDATAAIFISFLLFVFPSRAPNFMYCRRKDDTSPLGPRPALLDWTTVQRKLPWSVIMLLGGGFALADGCQESGLSDWLALQFAALAGIPTPVLVFIISVIICFFTEFTSNVATATIFLPILASLVSGLSHWMAGQFQAFSHFPPFIISIIITIIICAFTEVTSNTATATIFLPILAAMAESICVNPLYILIPATTVCSYAFMLPVATPPNAIAFSYGTLTVPDMVKAGIMMNVVGISVINLMINTLAVPMFDVFNYPDWAPDVNGTCLGVATTAMPNMTTEMYSTTTCVCY